MNACKLILAPGLLKWEGGKRAKVWKKDSPTAFVPGSVLSATLDEVQNDYLDSTIISEIIWEKTAPSSERCAQN